MMIQIRGSAEGIDFLAAERSRARIPRLSPPLLDAGPRPAAESAVSVRRAHENAQRNRFNRFCGSACAGRFDSAGKGSEDSSHWRCLRSGHCRTRHRALYIPTSAAYVSSSDSDTVAGKRAFTRSVAPFPLEPLAWCRFRWPLRARQNVSPGRRGRKWLIHQFRPAATPFRQLSTAYQHGWRRRYRYA